MSPPKRVQTLELSEEVRAAFGAPLRAADDSVRERIVVTRRVGLPGLENWSACDSTRLWSVFHTTYGFCTLTAIKRNETPRWRYRRRDYEMSLASVRLLEPGEMHVATRNPRTDFEVLQIDPELVTDPELGPLHFSSGQIDDARLAAKFVQLCARVREAEDDLEVQGLWCAFRQELAERAGMRATRTPHLCPRGVRRAREYLHDNFAQRISLDDLADVAGLSAFHLERTFREHVGLPLHRYLMKVRLGHAQTLLRSGQRVSDVAAQTGFCDASHLCRAFSADFGITPGAYAAPRTAAGT